MRHTLLFRLVAGLFTASLLTSCIYYNGPGGNARYGFSGIRGSGHSVTEVRQVSDFHRVRLDTQGDLSISIGDSESLVVEADDNFMAHIHTEVRGGQLRIYNDRGNWFRSGESIHYMLTVKSLDGIVVGSTGSVNGPVLEADHVELQVSSTGDIVLDGLKGRAVDIDVSSTGDITLGRLDATTLDVQISSTGHVSIRDGRVNSQDIHISSTGSYEAMDLDSAVASVVLSSTGSAYVTVRDYLEARLTSTGSLHYRGGGRTDIERSSVGRAIRISSR